MIAALLSYLPVLALALVIECTLVAAASTRGTRRDAATACLCLNLLTHPLGTLLAWRWTCAPELLWLVELLFEWVGYTRLLRISAGRALAITVLADVCSGVAALLVFAMSFA